MTNKEQHLKLAALLNAYIELADAHNYSRMQIRGALLGMFTRGELVELGFSHIFENHPGEAAEMQENMPELCKSCVNSYTSPLEDPCSGCIVNGGTSANYRKQPTCEEKYGPCWVCRNPHCAWWKHSYVLETAREAIHFVLETNKGWCKVEGTAHNYDYAVSAEYRDRLKDKGIAEILEAAEPMDALMEKLDDYYSESIRQEEAEIEGKAMKELAQRLNMDKNDIPEELAEEVRSYLFEIVCIHPDYDHFLKQKVMTNIFMDTGDGLQDYIANSLIPPSCYSAFSHSKESIREEASLIWLAQQQGYSKDMFLDAMFADTPPSDSFLASVYTELENCTGHMPAVTFLVRMTLEQLIQLNTAIHMQERNGLSYDNRDYPDCGILTVSKETTACLYDFINGAGDPMGIELEKDVEIPIRFIRSALPDGQDHRSLEVAFGVMRSVWTETVLGIDVPEDLEDADVYQAAALLNQDSYTAETLRCCRQWLKDCMDEGFSLIEAVDMYASTPESIRQELSN